ncbi:MAG: uracil-DNA glycosylase [Flavobacteriaceae bacterium CG_4_8_14_3_um_filter_34_10]|nr:uracil-DNA glycosylase [Flavobacteriia bacterium]OIP52292.1 MAG: uracil-DNA glycosylase [Flavobacteriaceae bacterium CG2_30_34_30]PIQ17746.1 MAG: uracil-DNA glycosylase [Flavobacteriaceae bacterium CG18_big_fil_WC_8_21_14_2_50_34_36]PIV51476.1 MAG: uracil-DNA glycosylase [Flavobacteriaceae bacterium CG02_land_8_20_14_3_00_34_13]PIX09979.1 MAG: uracil-DNA glycosylase [Flavobacteriaceae bacterium CG_4_8_14_3_um_filter_34_10]PIZ07734.1 MAG: uracil-DNA glycosylase [Flavobacteriaceae bacterium C
MHEKIEESWREKLSAEFEKNYFKSLSMFLEEEYRNHLCFPPLEEVFSAFTQTPFSKVKVVIIGQDPYHGLGQANGLCFSVHDTIPKPPSLKNIFLEIKNDLHVEIPHSGNLEPWAKQGVLLLNTTLTVRAHQPASHQKKGWEVFTDRVINTVSENKNGVVFLLWGEFAKKKIQLIDQTKHLVLTSGHPSPLCANRGYWFGNKHFSTTNKYLKERGGEQINW